MTSPYLDHDPVTLSWARTVRGISQRALAKVLEIHQGHLSEMESGQRNCSTDLQEKIAEELNCPVEILAARRPQTGRAPPPLKRPA